MIAEAREGSSMEAFVSACGLRPGVVDVRRQQAVGELDLDAVRRLRADAECSAVGYRLESWAGATPPDRQAPLAEAYLALNDAPMGDLDYGDEVWDAERVRHRDAAVAAAGLRVHAVLALAPDGAPAGYTDVGVSEDGQFGWQWGTAVAPAHRGHRLAMLLKTAMVERLRALEPALTVVSTWNAEVNRHMIEVNEALGYLPVDRMAEWQLALGNRRA